jgi:hypothetical protein
MLKIWELGKGKMAAAKALRQQVGGGFSVIFYDISNADNSTFNKKINFKAFPDPTVFRCDPSAREPAMADMEYAIIEEDISEGSFKKQFGDWKDNTGRGDSQNWEKGSKKRIFSYWKIVKNPSNVVSGMDGKSYDEKELRAWPEGQEKPDFGEDPKTRTNDNAEVWQYIIANREVKKKIKHPGCRLPYKVIEGREYVIDGKKSLQSMGLHAESPQRKLDFIESQKFILFSKGPLEMVFVPTEGDSAGLTDKIQDAARNGSKNVIVIPYKSIDENGHPIGAPTFRPQMLVDPNLSMESNSAIQAIEACFGMTQGAWMAQPKDMSGIAIHASEVQGETANNDFPDNWLTGLEELFRDVLHVIPMLGIQMQIKLAGDDQKDQVVWINNQVAAKKSGMQNYDLDEDEEYSLVINASPSAKSMRDKSFDQMMSYAEKFPMMAALIPDLAAKSSLDNTYSDEISQRANKFVAHTAPWALGANTDPRSQALMTQLQQAQQQMQQMQQAMAALQQKAQQELQEMQSRLQGLSSDKSNEAMKIKLEADAKAKSQEIDAFNALTNRLKVEQAAANAVLSPSAMLTAKEGDPISGTVLKPMETNASARTAPAG